MKSYLFSIVAVRLRDAYVLVQEKKHSQKWYLPAGRVEPGETFAEAAIRETKEESGIDIDLTGLVRMEHRYINNALRIRAVFTAEPSGQNQKLKSQADEHTLQAVWATPKELKDFDLRSTEVPSLLKYLTNNGQVHSLSILKNEGEDYF